MSQGGANGAKKENERSRDGRMAFEPGCDTGHRRNEKRALVRRGVETTFVHGEGGKITTRGCAKHPYPLREGKGSSIDRWREIGGYQECCKFSNR